MINTKTEKEQASMVGKRVRTLKLIPNVEIERGYVLEAREHAGSGKKGIIINYSNSHGICYKVKHADGTQAFYEPEELELIKV